MGLIALCACSTEQINTMILYVKLDTALESENSQSCTADRDCAKGVSIAHAGHLLRAWSSVRHCSS